MFNLLIKHRPMVPLNGHSRPILVPCNIVYILLAGDGHYDRLPCRVQ